MEHGDGGRNGAVEQVRDLTGHSDSGRSIEAELQQAVSEERQRLSRELHDSVSQAFYSIILGAKTARSLLGSDSRALDPIEFVLAQAENGLAEMRSLISELRPEMLEREGLVENLRRQGEALERRRQVAVSLSLCDEPEIAFPVKEALYRIAQEALHNTAKHSRATEVGIALSTGPTEIVLHIWDDGVGFDTRSAFPGHVGLHSMRERVERVGGGLRIESDGTGTRVWAHVPVGADRAG